jgi:hypothetical protein
MEPGTSRGSLNERKGGAERGGAVAVHADRRLPVQLQLPHLALIEAAERLIVAEQVDEA